MTTPSKPEASLRGALDLARALPCRCLSVAQLGERDPGCNRCRLVTLLSSLSARDEAGAVAKLQAFKDYVHQRLDAMGVPVDPESPHKAAGCRIGGRLDYVEANLATPPASGEAGADEAANARRLHDYPHLLAFFDKHAFGPKLAPSCLCCGQSTQGRAIGVQHLELPGIVICQQCRLAAVAPAGMDGWQPIETAPKDGTTVLLYSPDRCGNCPEGTSGIGNARWLGEEWIAGRLLSGAFVKVAHQPTHWQPLPTPPATAGKE